MFVFQSWSVIQCINVLLIMAEHPPLLDTTQILSSDISLLSAPIVSADGTQQVRKLKYLFLYVEYTYIYAKFKTNHTSEFLLFRVLNSQFKMLFSFIR